MSSLCQRVSQSPIKLEYVNNSPVSSLRLVTYPDGVLELLRLVPQTLEIIYHVVRLQIMEEFTCYTIRLWIHCLALDCH